MARILKEEGYIANFKATEEEGRKVLRVYLKYGPDNDADLRPKARVASRLPRLRRAQRDSARARRPGINILTTPRGVMTGRQARKEGVGGEVLVRFTSAMWLRGERIAGPSTPPRRGLWVARDDNSFEGKRRVTASCLKLNYCRELETNRSRWKRA